MWNILNFSRTDQSLFSASCKLPRLGQGNNSDSRSCTFKSDFLSHVNHSIPDRRDNIWNEECFKFLRALSIIFTLNRETEGDLRVVTVLFAISDLLENQSIKQRLTIRTSFYCRRRAILIIDQRSCSCNANRCYAWEFNRLPDFVRLHSPFRPYRL